jgi:hypothetical protein
MIRIPSLIPSAHGLLWQASFVRNGPEKEYGANEISSLGICSSYMRFLSLRVSSAGGDAGDGRRCFGIC